MTLGRRAFRGQLTDGDLGRLMGSSPPGAAARTKAGSAGAAAHAGQPEVRVACRARPRGGAGGHVLQSERPGNGVAPLVLPVELDSRRHAARRGEAGEAAAAGRDRSAGAPDARRSEERALRHQLRRAVAVSAEPEESDSRLGRPPELRRQPAPVVPQGDRALRRQHRAREPAGPRSDDRRLHVPERAARPALRLSQHLRQPVPPRDAPQRRPARAPRAGQRPDGHVARRSRRRWCAEWILDNLLGAPPPRRRPWCRRSGGRQSGARSR